MQGSSGSLWSLQSCHSLQPALPLLHLAQATSQPLQHRSFILHSKQLLCFDSSWLEYPILCSHSPRQRFPAFLWTSQDPPLLGAMPHLHGVAGSSGAGGMPGAEAAGAWQQACCRAGSGWKQTGSSLGDTWHPTSCPAATWCSTEQEGREMFLACKLWGPVPVSCHADGTWHCNEGSKEKERSNGAEVKAVCCFVWCIFLLSACVTCMFQGVLWQWLANWRVWWSVSTKMRIERQRYKVSPETLLL